MLITSLFNHIESFFASNLDLILQILLHCIVLSILIKLIDKSVSNVKDRIYKNPDSSSLLHLVLLLTKVVKVIVALCILGSFLQCRGYSLSSVMTGLGITGLAIGFAAKEMLSSVLGSIMIMADKVYRIGDYVTINGVEGVVETINFRSTKIRTISNTLITIPNNITADTIVHNRSDSEYFRIIEKFDIEYGTPDEKVEEALEILNEICDENDDIKSGHISMVSKLGESAITLQLIANTTTNHWMKFLRIKDRLYKETLQRFRQAGISFAFPSRSVYVRKDED